MLHRIHQLKNRRKWSIGIFDRLSRLSGWRKSAFINTLLVSIAFLVLLSFHVFLWAKSGNLAGYHIIHSGRCAGNGVGRLNTLLHLIINILSSLVLASTNFFMQVLNAPSRAELDSAHERGSWLDIGVPSPRNVFRVSLFKTTMWLLFFLSSIPIHLLFNSAIFSTDNRGSMFSYFVFDESVLAGGAAFDPGTSLALPDGYFINWGWRKYFESSANNWTNSTVLESALKQYSGSVYSDRSESVDNTVEEIRKGGWHKLNKSNCISLYNTSSCSGLRAYRNVALILSGYSGWNRSQVWSLPANESLFWDAYMPKDVNNSLWFFDSANHSHSPCIMTLTTIDVDSGNPIHCENSCSFDMGLEGRLSNADVWNYDLFSGAGSGIRFVPTPPTSEFQKSSLSVEYCLAEPFGTFCQIGLASTLLWVVSLCILLKTVLCFVVLIKLGKHTSLVTPGDVIESFISHPPDYSLGSCLLEKGSLKSYRDGNGNLPVPEPMKWDSKRYRRWHAIPKRVWLSSHFIFISGIGPLIYFVISSYHVTRWLGSFGQDAQNEKVWFRNGFLPTFEQAILIANSPQLFLSFAYLAFNGLFTRLHMAKEWSVMGTRYKALRVTNPKGQQSSTYFLQLPYRYSIPLLTISILLHWTLSGCIYILLMQGDYFGSSGSDGPFGSSMALGFSTKSLFTMLTLSVFMAFMPLLFGLIPLPPKTFVVGSNSLAIAAACQVSPLIGQNQPRAEKSYHKSTAEPQNDEIELRHLIAPSYSLLPRDDQASNSRNDEEVWKDTLLRVSQSKIKWGVVEMPSSWEEQFNRRDIAVEHISFGLPEDDVQQPVMGHWYA